MPKVSNGGVYFASKAVKYGRKWKDLRDAGLPVISTWIDESAAEDMPEWPDLWRRCLDESSRAEVLIVYCEPGDFLKGTWIEVGSALASKVPVLAVGIEDHTIAKSGLIKICSTLDEALDEARVILGMVQPDE